MDERTKKIFQRTRLICNEMYAHRRNPARSLKHLRSLLPDYVTVDKLHGYPGHLRLTVHKNKVREGNVIVGLGTELNFTATMIVHRKRAGLEVILKDRFSVRPGPRVRTHSEW